MRRILLALGLIFGLAAPALALDCGDTDTYGYTQGSGGWYLKADRSGPYALDSSCAGHLIGPSNGNIATAQVSVAATPTLVTAARTGRNSVTVVNLGTTAVYLGGAAVTTSTGTLLAGTVGTSVTIATSAAVYGVVATGTESVSETEVF